jgi:hypothetical protein
MDLFAVLDQVIELLRRRGRVTYSALRLQFGLNDEQLAVLKEELIDAQQLVHDEEGRILVWTGDTAAPPSSLLPSARHASRPVTQAVSVPQTNAPPRPPPRQGPNAASSRCCSAIWWTPPCWPASMTQKSGARWCGRIKTRDLRQGDRPL